MLLIAALITLIFFIAIVQSCRGPIISKQDKEEDKKVTNSDSNQKASLAHINSVTHFIYWQLDSWLRQLPNDTIMTITSKDRTSHETIITKTMLSVMAKTLWYISYDSPFRDFNGDGYSIWIC